MSRGVKEFVGLRLEEARLARGLTQTNLAQLVGKNSSTVSAWESERQYPDRDSIQSLATSLSVRPTLFEKNFDLVGKSHFYRSNASITATLQKKAKSRLRWAELISSELEEWVDFAEVDIPFCAESDLLKITDSEIDAMALICRERWGLGLGPIDDTISVLENCGAIVVRDELGGLKMDGVSAWSEISDRPFVLIATDKASSVRSRFDSMHELGHIVMHQNIDPEILSKAEYSELERQAHRFASSFLMPEKTFLSEVRGLDLDSFLRMKNKWRVSIGAMIMRCYQLDIIHDEYRQRLFKYMSQRGWRREEPLDDVLKPEIPTALSAAIMLLIDAGKYGREELLELIGLNAPDVETLAALPNGYLQREAASVVRLKDYRV